MAVCEREEEDLVAFILEHERLVAGKEPFQVYARLQRLWEIMQESIHRESPHEGSSRRAQTRSEGSGADEPLP